MRGILSFFVVITACVVSAMPKSKYAPYPRHIEIPGEDGEMHKVDLEAEPDMEALDQVLKGPGDNNRYYLYTRRNPARSQELVFGNAQTIWQSNYQGSNPTAVIVHGWLGNQNSNLNELITAALLQIGDYNVIVMDWRRLAILDYVTAVVGVPSVGRSLGEFTQWLSNQASDLGRFHLIGFSLGAHIVGTAGRTVGGRVRRVTGLDPAGPLWVYNSNKLSANDGIYVEAIHTDGGVGGLGIGSAIANVDFFVNGGNSQPGCLTSICNHNRACELFAATVKYNHLIGRGCSNNLQVTWNTCRGDLFPMGNADLNKSGSGMYRVETGRQYPY